VGALFEAAFRRLGGSLLSYLLYTVAFGLVPVAAAAALRATDAGGVGAQFAFWLAFALGHFLLVGTLSALVAGTRRGRTSPIVVSTSLVAVLWAVVTTLFPPLGVLVYPVLALAAVAAAVGDAGPVAALAHAGRLVRRFFARAYLVLFGLALTTVALWVGWVIALSPLGPDLREIAAFLVTCLLLWPVAALVQRNFYGDLTGRQVVGEAQERARRRTGRR
jgi:hypothetical protein